MNIFLFTAPSASGKTTISKAVSERLDLPRIDLHKILHGLATEQGYVRARDWVVSVGIEEVLNQTRLRIFGEIEINKNIRGIIVDEIIDEDTLNLIKYIYPESNIRIVYIQTGRDNRIKFISKRIDAENEKQGEEEIQFIDHLKQKLGIDRVIKQADIRVCNDCLIEDAVDEVSKYVEMVFRNPEGTVKRERE